jgi:hypothetical protein
MQAFKDRLTGLEQNKPADVILPKLFYEDVNAETLAVSFADGYPSSSLWSDEGGLVIGANGMNDDNLMRFVALLNRLWDGQSFERDRLTAKSARIVGRRFTVSLMMQPIVMARFLGACGGATRNMGFIARNLIAWPASTIGNRPYRDPPADASAINKFNARMRELLNMKLVTEGSHMALTPPRLPLSFKAKIDWTGFFNSTESEMRRSGEFEDVADIGAKIAEQAARIAGTFHVVTQGPEGQIAGALMEGAIAVASWHLNEVRRVMSSSAPPQDVDDAAVLLEWMLGRGPDPIDPREILQFGPFRLRSKKRRDAALGVLIGKNYVAACGKPIRLVINPKARAPS